MWPFRKKPAPIPTQKKKNSISVAERFPKSAALAYPTVDLTAPIVPGMAMDSKFQRFGLGDKEGMGQSVGDWYASQRFIGHAQSAWIAKHWLVDKAINMPARDALRYGWEIDSDDEALVGRMLAADKKYKIIARMHELIASARRTGGAVAIMLTCPAGEDEKEYYAAPLNIEAVREYHGVAVVDATDTLGEPLPDDLINPASLMYMTPTFYRIGNARYHMSHCTSVTPYPVADIIKPTYRYWGASLPERIYERVYAAERSANEGPLLLVTKRLRALGIDFEALLSGGEEAMDILRNNIACLQEVTDNFGVYVHDTSGGGGLSQLETALGDVDSVIMTQYQLVAAVAEIPITKLLGTTPKGFNATGESEAEDYRQHLESIQVHDMQPLLEKHYRIVAHLEGLDIPEITWLPLDSPTAEEFAEIDSRNGQTVAALVGQMVISPRQGAEILSQQKDSMFYGIDIEQDNELSDETDDLLNGVINEAGQNEDKEDDPPAIG